MFALNDIIQLSNAKFEKVRTFSFCVSGKTAHAVYLYA